MSRHVDEILTLIDTVLGDRPGNDDGPEVAPAPDEEPATTPAL